MVVALTENPGRTMNDADLKLAQRCHNGDINAFEELYCQHARRLYKLFLRLTRHKQDAEDLLHEMFLLIPQKLGSYQGDAAIGSWLYRVATNHGLDHLRSGKVKMQQTARALDDPETEGKVAKTPTVEDQLGLTEVINQLPKRCRAVFLLFMIEGYDHSEIAAMLDIAENTSKQHLFMARKKLQAILS